MLVGVAEESGAPLLAEAAAVGAMGEEVAVVEQPVESGPATVTTLAEERDDVVDLRLSQQPAVVSLETRWASWLAARALLQPALTPPRTVR